MALSLLWIAMAFLAAVAALPVLMTLARARPAGPVSAQAAAIYRDQLGELDRDVAAGTIAPAEADAARTEIARRLIKAGDETEAARPSRSGGTKLAAAAIIAMPLAALALYLFLGSPQYPDQPLAQRTTPIESQDVDTLVAAVETHLAANPEDGAGWDVIAPVYLRLGRNADAATAFSNAIRILGPTSVRETGLGEAIAGASGGTITPDARAAFQRAADLAPDDPRPRFYLALALQQDGKPADALAAWRELLAGAPADAPWTPVVREQIAGLEGAASVPGPTAEDVAAAADMTAEDRDAMIAGMVASLAAKLEDSPVDPEGWARLVRSYMVLGRPADARAALAKARAALAGDAAGVAAVEAAAAEAGVTEQE